METKDDSLESSAISALLSYPKTARHSNIHDILSKFNDPLKTNFENKNLWLRFGLSLHLSKSPRSAIQAFNECLRIDQNDPLPAMLAAKIMLEDLDEPDEALLSATIAIDRCKGLKLTKNRTQLLSRSYLLASISHCNIYEREPESIRQFKTSNLKASVEYLDLALQTHSADFLLHFHKALHLAKQKNYPSAIDNIRQAIKLNPHHVPSMQLLILSLSALKLYNEALNLCDSTLHEFEDNLLLLHIKCNLEQCLNETKGYTTALNTAQHILKCIRLSSSGVISSEINNKAEQQPTVDNTKQATSLFAENNNNLDETKDQFFSCGELSAWLLVAEIFIKLGSIHDAELCVDEGSTHANGAISYQIMFVRGLIAKAKNNLNEAKNFFQSCLALYPRHSEALQQIANVHFLLGNHSTAEKFLKDSLDINSDCHKTWYYLSQVFIETNQHDKAHECIEKAKQLEEFSPAISISAISSLTFE